MTASVQMEKGEGKMEKSRSFGYGAASTTLFHFPFSLYHSP